MIAGSMMPAIRAMQRDLIIGGWHPAEPVTVSEKKGLDTACWSFLPPSRHRIYIGTGARERARTGLTNAQLEYYVGSYVAHEYSHALHTERDMAATEAMLTSIGCPFDLFNLFEDARVEELWRELTWRRFAWSSLEDLAVDGEASPAALFFLLVQGEGVMPAEGACPDLLAEVEQYYRAALAAANTLALKPLLADWIKRFGAEVPPRLRFLGGDGGELATAAMLQADAGFRARFEAPDPADADHLDPLIRGHVESGLLDAEEHEFDFAVADRLAGRMESLFRAAVAVEYGNDPSTRISAKRSVMGQPCYRHHHEGKVPTRRIGLVLDCSGSMDGSFIEAGRLLIGALNVLATKGRVQGPLVLSGVSNDEALSGAFQWPVAESVIQRIHAFGEAEGLQAAITTHVAALVGCDEVLVFTDGNITDAPLRLAGLQGRGVFVRGLYVGDYVAAGADLAKHFDWFLVRDTLEGLIDALLNRRRRRPG